MITKMLIFVLFTLIDRKSIDGNIPGFCMYHYVYTGCLKCETQGGEDEHGISCIAFIAHSSLSCVLHILTLWSGPDAIK